MMNKSVFRPRYTLNGENQNNSKIFFFPRTMDGSAHQWSIERVFTDTGYTY